MEELDEIIDKNLKIIFEAKNQKFLAYEILDFKNKKLAPRAKAYHYADKMVERNLIIRTDDYCFMTSFGNTVQSNGGWKKYLVEQKDKIEKKEQREIIELKNIEYQIKVNIWLVKTKWWPLILSILALIISIWGIFRK